MGRREIIVTGLFAWLAAAVAVLVAAYASDFGAAGPRVIRSGWLAVALGIGGLAYMFRSAAKLDVANITSREFLEAAITPAVLRSKTENRTSVQIDALTKTYAGKWMRITGSVIQVSEIGIASSRRRIAMIDEANDKTSFTTIIFGKRWFDQLGALNKGDQVEMVGRINRLEHGPTLVDGEIVHVGPPASSPESQG